jgi:DHA1 family bicyclomycin/chloramphenicol resistance-like MFS transporter
LIVTAVLILFSIAVVFPINILYPLSLEIVPHMKGRSAGLGQTMLLLLTASLIETVSYFYNGWFMSIGLAMILSIMISLVLVRVIIYKKWLHLDN